MGDIPCGGATGGDGPRLLLRGAEPPWLAGVWRCGRTVSVVLTGRLLLARYDAVRMVLADAVAEFPARIEVDLGAVTLMSPSVVGALDCAQRTAFANGCRLVVTGAHDRAAGLLHRLRLLDRLTDPG